METNLLKRIIRDYPHGYQVYLKHFVSSARTQFRIEWDEFMANLIDHGGDRPLRQDWNERLLIFLKLALPLAKNAAMSTTLFKNLLFVLAQGRRVHLSRKMKRPTSRIGIRARCCFMVMSEELFMFHHVLAHDSLREPNRKCTECARGTRYRLTMICQRCLNKNAVQMTSGQLSANQQMYDFYDQLRRCRVLGRLRVYQEEGAQEEGVGNVPQEVAQEEGVGNVPQEVAQENECARGDQAEPGQQEVDIQGDVSPCGQWPEMEGDDGPQVGNLQEVVLEEESECDTDAQDGDQTEVRKQYTEVCPCVQQEAVPPELALQGSASPGDRLLEMILEDGISEQGLYEHVTETYRQDYAREVAPLEGEPYTNLGPKEGDYGGGCSRSAPKRRRPEWYGEFENMECSEEDLAADWRDIWQGVTSILQEDEVHQIMEALGAKKPRLIL